MEGNADRREVKRRAKNRCAAPATARGTRGRGVSGGNERTARKGPRGRCSRRCRSPGENKRSCARPDEQCRPGAGPGGMADVRRSKEARPGCRRECRRQSARGQVRATAPFGHYRRGTDSAGTRDGMTNVLDQFETGEEIANLEGGGIGPIGAMRAVVADAGTEIVANGAGRGFLGVGCTHGVAPLLNGAFGFKDDGENLARRHKVREFTKEGAFAVNGVESTRLLLREAHGFDGYNLEASFVDARQDLALKISADCIRLDDCEGALDCHEKSFLFWAAKVRRQDTGNAKLITSAL